MSSYSDEYIARMKREAMDNDCKMKDLVDPLPKIPFPDVSRGTQRRARKDSLVLLLT